MTLIHTAKDGDPKRVLPLMLTDQQILDLGEEMEDYNNKFSHLEPFRDIGEYVVHLLEVLERDLD